MYDKNIIKCDECNTEVIEPFICIKCFCDFCINCFVINQRMCKFCYEKKEDKNDV